MHSEAHAGGRGLDSESWGTVGLGGSPAAQWGLESRVLLDFSGLGLMQFHALGH